MPQKTFTSKGIADLDQQVNEFRKPLEDMGTQIFSQSDYIMTNDENMCHKTTLMWTPKTSLMNNGTQPQKIRTNEESGAAWKGKKEGELNLSMNNGSRKTILTRDLVHIQDNVWSYTDNEGNKMIFRTNVSDNPRAPIYRVYNT